MQEYVNIDYRNTLSIVGLIGEPGEGRIIAEARYVRIDGEDFADIAFVVDEAYQGKGVATFLFKMLINLARDRGIDVLKADVLSSNKSMLKVLEKAPFPVKALLDTGVYELKIPISEKGSV